MTGELQIEQKDVEDVAVGEQNCVLAYWLDDRDFALWRMEQYLQTHWVGFQASVKHHLGKFFVIKLGNRQEMLAVIQNSPFSIAGGMLAVRRWGAGIVLNRIVVEKVMIGVRFHDLPPECYNKKAAKKIVDWVGERVDVELYVVPAVNIRYMRARIMVNPRNPLIPGFYIRMPNGHRFWVQCRYERMHKFCRRCGRIGHPMNRCPIQGNVNVVHFVEQKIREHNATRGTRLVFDPAKVMFPACMRAHVHRAQKRSTAFPDGFMEYQEDFFRFVPEENILDGFQFSMSNDDELDMEEVMQQQEGGDNGDGFQLEKEDVEIQDDKGKRKMEEVDLSRKQEEHHEPTRFLQQMEQNLDQHCGIAPSTGSPPTNTEERHELQEHDQTGNSETLSSVNYVIETPSFVIEGQRVDAFVTSIDMPEMQIMNDWVSEDKNDCEMIRKSAEGFKLKKHLGLGENQSRVGVKEVLKKRCIAKEGKRFQTAGGIVIREDHHLESGLRNMKLKAGEHGKGKGIATPDQFLGINKSAGIRKRMSKRRTQQGETQKIEVELEEESGQSWNGEGIETNIVDSDQQKEEEDEDQEQWYTKMIFSGDKKEISRKKLKVQDALMSCVIVEIDARFKVLEV